MRPITVPIIGDKRARMGNDFLIPIEQQQVESIGLGPLEEGIRNEENLPRRPTKRALPSVLGIILIYSCSSYRGRETKELIPRDGHDACSNKDQSWTAEDPRLGLSKTFRRPRAQNTNGKCPKNGLRVG